MEIDEAKLEKILARQADRVARESDRRLDNRLRKLNKDLDKRFATWSKESEERMDKRFATWSQESEERMQRYIGMLKEDFDHKLDAVMEYVKDIPDMKERQELMFEKIGEIAVRLTVLEEIVKRHEVQLRG